jgi:hypothetical protein
VRKIMGAVGVSLLSAMPAMATVVQATFSGTVSSGTDALGLFGAAGGNLAQTSAQMSFRFDTSLGAPVSDPFAVDGVWGGSMLGSATPMLDATVTIGGVSITSDATRFGYAALLADPSFGQSEQFQARGSAVAQGQTYATQISALFYGPGFSLPLHLDAPYTLTNLAAMAGQPNSQVFGDASFTFCPTTGNCLSTHPYFNWTNFSVAPVVTAAVPLPASGLLLVAALGGAGAVRRQRKVA